MEKRFSVGDIIETKKAHPCGGREWAVIRTGADYKIKCASCGRIVMMPYEDFIRRVKKVVKHSEAQQGT